MNPNNLELQRAKHALKKIEALLEELQEGSKYLSYAKSLPAAILQNGLGQAMATLLAASGENKLKEDDHGKLYLDIQSWLCRNDEMAPYRNKKDLMQAITEGGQSSYIHAQAEAMAWLNWLKKFAVALLTDKKEKTKEETP